MSASCFALLCLQTLELEDALKRLSGENKKFDARLNGAVPQVDGLEEQAAPAESIPHPDLTAQLDQAAHDVIEQEAVHDVIEQAAAHDVINQEAASKFTLADDSQEESINDHESDVISLERLQDKSESESDSLEEQAPAASDDSQGPIEYTQSVYDYGVPPYPGELRASPLASHMIQQNDVQSNLIHVWFCSYFHYWPRYTQQFNGCSVG